MLLELIRRRPPQSGVVRSHPQAVLKKLAPRGYRRILEPEILRRPLELFRVVALRIAYLRLEGVVAYPRRLLADLLDAASQRDGPCLGHVVESTCYTILKHFISVLLIRDA